MPIHFSNLTRRELLGRALFTAGATSIPASAWSSSSTDPDRFALFSDTHISENAGETNRGVNMSRNLERALLEVLASARRPSGLVLTGDCAYLSGLAGDYSRLAELFRPALPEGLPVHFLLGNHDDRANFRAGIRQSVGRLPLETKHVAVIRSRRANLFLLDSLDKVNITPGKLGGEQLEWLQRSLDRHSDRPALIFVHHHPQLPQFGIAGGIAETERLFELLVPRTHVKAVFFGHTHHWNIQSVEGIHCVNLPPVAYVFNSADPSGWVDLQVKDYSATLRLASLSANHPLDGATQVLRWR